MLTVFTDVVLPVLVVVGLGALIGRWRGLSPGPYSALVLYLLSPALVFDNLSRTTLTLDIAARVALTLAASMAVLAIVAIGWSRWRRHDPAMRSAVALVAILPNFGNMGLAIATLAFGRPGLEVAVFTFVLGAIASYTVGMAVGSSATGASRREVLTTPFRYPFVYAAVLGVAVNALDVPVPLAISEPVAILADATIPLMLIVLGLQLRHGMGADDLPDLAAVAGARLLVAPVVAWVVATALGLDGIARATLVTVASMPAAVVTTIIATEFGARPAFVTRAVVVTTLLSLLSLTVLIDLVR